MNLLLSLRTNMRTHNEENSVMKLHIKQRHEAFEMLKAIFIFPLLLYQRYENVQKFGDTS